MKSAVSALLLLTLLVPIYAQTPEASLDSAAIAGKVVSIAGEALPKAVLHLRTTTAAGGNYTVSTDGQGGFVFDAVPSGRYRLSADRAGYLQQFYGSRAPGLSGGRDIVAGAGSRLEDVLIKLTPQASIAGRIFDEDGDPVSGAVVIASRIGYANGKKQAVGQRSTGSNPDGTFTCWNLEPGRYYVSALDQRTAAFTDETPAGGKALRSYLTTYFPSAIDESSATPVMVAAGADVRGIDVHLVAGRKYRIRGKLTGLARQDNFPGMSVMLDPKIPGARSQPASLLRPDGSFAFAEVVPGDYIVRVQTSLGGPLLQQAYQEVSISDRDLDLEVPLSPPPEITGTVRIIQNDAAVALTPQPVVLFINTDNPAISVRSSSGSSADAFRMQGLLAARYRVSLPSLPPGILVKSIRFGGQELSQGLLDLRSGGEATLEILLSPTAPDLTGVVHNEDGAAMPDATVSIWKPGTGEDSASEVRTDAMGRFQFQNLAPGDYLLGAWDELEPGLAQVPEFRSAFESSAVKIKLEESGHNYIDVKVFSSSSVASALAKLP